MNLNNITGKLRKNAENIGIVAGALNEGIDPLIADIQIILSGQGHLPDIGPMVQEYVRQPIVKSTFMLWLAGYALKEFGYGKYGAPIQKFSEGMLKGKAIQHIIWWSTHADEGSAPAGVHAMFNRVVRNPDRRNVNVNPLMRVTA